MRRVRRWLCAALACAVLAAGLSVPAAAAGFTDVPAGHWAAGYIQEAAASGLVQGESATRFGLGRSMTRAAFTVVLCRLFGWETVTPAQGTFSDVQDGGAWYYAAVETAYANGALTDQSDTFRPADAITREEMAVMLVRALGLTPIAGLEQGLLCPFQDVETHKGYLTMAYYLGISGGTTATTFSPEQTATREQAVAMLMRVYERLRQTPERIGCLSGGAEDLPDLAGYAAVAYGQTALRSKTLSGQPAGGDADVFCVKARSAGALALLRVTVSASALREDAAAQAALIAAAAAGYDGVLLDAPDLAADQAAAHLRLVRAVDAAADGALYVTAEAPESSGAAHGYDCAALSACADRLILRTASYDLTLNDFPTLPQEPLEEVYYALASLKAGGGVDLTKCSLWLTTTGRASRGGRETAVTGGEIAALLSGGAEDYYSQRYAQAYLTDGEGRDQTVVWYHDGAAAEARTQLTALFGAAGLCLSDGASWAEWLAE